MSITTIEDLLQFLSDSSFDKNSFSSKDRSIIFSMAAQLSKKNLPLTEKQALLAISILKSNPEFLAINDDFKNLLDYPKFKNPFRVIDTQKRIFLYEFENIRFIAIKYQFSKEINQRLQKLSSKKIYSSVINSYLLRLKEENISKVFELFPDFDFDNILITLNEKIQEIRKNPENFVPSIDLEGDQILIKNENKNIKTYFESKSRNNFLNDLFLSKSMNLYFSDAIKNKINQENCDDFTKYLLLSSSTKFFLKDKVVNVTKKMLMSAMRDLQSYPVLLMMPEETNIDDKMQDWIEIFQEFGIKNEEISVLFRSNTNKKFNEIIKENRLNNLVDEKTKFVIVNYKIPKILYKINFIPAVIISTTSFHVHFNSQRMVESHPFVLYYTEEIEKD